MRRFGNVWKWVAAAGGGGPIVRDRYWSMAEKFSGVRSGVRSVCGKVLSHAARCLAGNQYNSMYLIWIYRRVRPSAEECEKGEFTFRVRCIQPGSATSPLCLQPLAVLWRTIEASSASLTFGFERVL